MIHKYKNLIAGCFILLFSLVFFLTSFSIKLTQIDTFVGSRLFPQIITVLLMLLSVWIIIENIVKNRKGIIEEEVQEDENEHSLEKANGPKQNYFKTILVFVSLALYISILDSIGFMISTIIYLFTQMFLLESKGKRKLIQYLVVSVISTVVIFYLFTEVFNLVLPRGRLF